MIKQNGNFLFSAFILLLLVLFFDSLNSTIRFSKIEKQNVDLHNNPQAEIQAHMKLFRAQRNLYITGFSLFMLIVLRRLVTLISLQATLEASHEAALKQAKGAAEQAQKFMDENDELRKGNRTQATSDTELEDEKKDMTIQLNKLREELKESEMKYEKSSRDLSALKSQSEGLHKEYDRLLDEHNKLEKKLSIAGGADGTDSKKDD